GPRRVRAAEPPALLRSALELDAGRVKTLRTVAAEIAARAHDIARLDRVAMPPFAPIGRQVSRRGELPHLGGAVFPRDSHVVANMRARPEHRDDLPAHLA